MEVRRVICMSEVWTGFVRKTVKDPYVLAAEIFFDSQLHTVGRRNNINCHAPQYLLAMAEWQIFVGTDLAHSGGASGFSLSTSRQK